MTLSARIRRLEKVASPTAPPWWSDIPDHVLPEPGRYFVSNLVDELRDIMGLAPFAEPGWRERGAPHVTDGRERRWRAMTAGEVNRWAAARGSPEVPLSDVNEFAQGSWHYVMSPHWRPIVALALYAFEMLATEEEMAAITARAELAAK